MIDLFYQFRDLLISKTAKDTSIVFLGNSISAILGIIFTILAARILNPENWGIVAAVMNFINIAAAVGDLGLSSSLFRFSSREWASGDTDQAQRLLQTIFNIRIITATALLLTLVILAPWMTPLVFKISDARLVVIAAVALWASLIIDFQITAFQAKQSWKLAAFFISSVNLVRVLLIITWFIIGGLTTLSAVAIFAVSPLLVVLIALAGLKLSFKVTANWKAIIGDVIPFSGWMGLNRIVGAISSRLDVLFLLQLATPFETGIFAVARQIANGIPIVLGSFATVLAPRFAIYRGGNLRSYFYKGVGLSSLMSLAIVAGVFLAQPVISLFGPKYGSALPVLRWMLVGFIPFALATPTVNLLIYAFQKPKIIALLSLVQLPLVVLGNLLLIPRLGVMGPVVVIALWNTSTLVITAAFTLYYWRKQI